MKKTARQSVQKENRQIIYPPAIKKGDTIGLIAPAGSLSNKKKFTAGIRILEQKGYRVRYDRRLVNTKGYLAGSDQERADEFNSLWAAPDIKALVAARGGYGSLRMVDLIDMQMIRKIPKKLIGFSDLTVLLTAIHQKTGLVTYHGPVVTTLDGMNRASQTSFFNTLTGNTPSFFKAAKLEVLKAGKADGILLGGNLTTLVHTIATPYEIPWSQALLFIEDIGEAAYRLDRLLTHLSVAGRLQKVRGLILGTFSDDTGRENAVMRKAVHKRIIELMDGIDIPIWANYPIGHTSRNLTLPIGMPVEMDSDSGLLKFLNN